MPLKRKLVIKEKYPQLSKLRNEFAWRQLIKQRIKEANKAKLFRAIKDNPDLPAKFIKSALIAKTGKEQLEVYCLDE